MVGPYGSELAQVFPELNEQVGPFAPSPALPPEEQRMRLYDGLTGLLLHLAGNGPLVLLLDDIQWAPSLSLLTHMARRLGQSTALIVGVFRDQEFRETPSLMREWADLNRARLFGSLTLKPLAEEQTGQMVAHYFGANAAASLQERVHRTTKGNPFFIEEVVRSLAESGAVQPGASGWDVGDVERISIPESIRLVIDERVARLGDGARDVLGQAAVLGQEFSFPVLAAMSGLDEGALVGHVERATAARLLADRSARGGERYAFVDDQVQEALYAGISSVRRRRWHLRAGQAIEEVHSQNLDAHLEELTRHFVEGNDAEKAADYAYRAGVKADELFAWSRSIPLYRTALELWEELGGHLEQRANVLEQLGDASFKSETGVQNGVDYFFQALAIYEQLGDRRKQATIHSQIGREFTVSPNRSLANWDAGLAHFHLARAILEELPESVALGLLYGGLSIAHMQQLEIQQAAFWHEKELGVGERLGRLVLVAQVWNGSGPRLVRSGVINEGFLTTEKGWSLAVQHNFAYQADLGRFSGIKSSNIVKDPRRGMAWVTRTPDFRTSALGISLFTLTTYALSGDLREGNRTLEEVQAKLQMAGQAPYKHFAWHQGFLLSRSGSWGRAKELLDTGLHWVAELNFREYATDAAAVLGALCLELGEYGSSQQHLTSALDQYRSSGAATNELGLLPHLCELYVRTGQLDQADVHLQEAQAILARPEDWCGLAGDVALAEMLVRAAQGRHDEVAAAFARAVEVYQRYELRWDEAKAYYEWGCILAEGDERDAARELLRKAERMWDGMGAGPYAERCRQELSELE